MIDHILIFSFQIYEHDKRLIVGLRKLNDLCDRRLEMQSDCILG